MDEGTTRGRPDNASKTVREYVILHPEAKLGEVASLFSVSKSTVANQRRELMNLGLIPDVRRNSKWQLTPEQLEKQLQRRKEELERRNSGKQLEKPVAEDLIPPVAITKMNKNELITTAELIELADEDSFIESDDETRSKILRRLRSFAFNSKLSPETQMNAMISWTKLKDQTRIRELGPGVPLTKEAAQERLIKLCIAVGPEMWLAALETTLNKEKVESDEGKVPVDENPAVQGPDGSITAPGNDINL